MNVRRFFYLAFVLLSFVLLLYVSYVLGTTSGSLDGSVGEKVELKEDTNVTKLRFVDLSQVEALSWKPRIFLYKNFISQADADHIVALGRPYVERSKVVASSGSSEVHSARTSSGTFLMGPLGEDPIVKKYANKVAEWTHLPVDNAEAFYLLRYEMGEEYKPHLDYFSSTEEGRANLGRSGDRIATVIIYLESPKEGGETVFPQAGLTVPAIKGNAVLFWDQSTGYTGDPSTLHGGKPVLAGTKWAMTRWIRSTKY